MLVLMLVMALLIGAFLFMLYPAVMVGAPDTATIRIPKNGSEMQLRDSLTKYFGDSYASKVMRLVNFKKADLSNRYGAYKIEEGTNALTAMRKLTSGGQTPVRITINGFRSFPILIDRISRRLDFPADSLQAVLQDSVFLSQFGVTPSNAMVLFLDDTYELYWTATPREAVEKIARSYKFFWDADNRTRAAMLGLLPAQAVTLASIVDEETNNVEEKPTIARLYINRLHKGMKLQADPTVRFALSDYSIRRIKKEHLQVNSPYNTYLHAGLPPGPIRTTSTATLYNILHSEPNDYLYMCAKEDFSGTHNFASTFAEHQQNAMRYRAALDARGIK